MKWRLMVPGLALLLTGCGSMFSPSEWFADKDNAEPPAELVELKSPLSIQTLWSDRVGKGAMGELLKLVPYLHNGALYVADHTGTVQAFDARTGHELWKTETGLPISGGPGAGDGLVLVGTSDAEVIALDAATGMQKWSSRVNSEVLSVPKAASGVVVAHSMDGALFGLSVATGERLWSFERAMPVLTLRGSSSPVIDGPLVIAGFASGKLVAADLRSGGLVWEQTISAPAGRSELERMVDIDGDPVVVSGTVYVATFQGELAALDEGSGTVLWRRDMSSYAGIGADRSQVYITDAEDHVWAINPFNGASLWKQTKLHARRLTAPAVMDNYIVVGDFEGYLHWLSREDGSLLARTRVGDKPISSSPVVVDDIVYAYGDGGEVAAMRVLGPAQ